MASRVTPSSRSPPKRRPPCPVEIEAWARASPPPSALIRALAYANRRDRERAVGAVLRTRFAALSQEQLEAGLRSLCSDLRARDYWARFCDCADEERARNEAYAAQALACVVELREAVEYAMALGGADAGVAAEVNP
jgi:hypothetical protein